MNVLCRSTVAALAFAALAAVATPALGQSRTEVMRLVIDEAEALGMPPALALAVAQAESNFDPRAESKKGARGVMQIMPATAWEMGVHPDELWDARLNVQVGIDFLRQLIQRYNGRWDLALSYYNGGSAVGSGANARVIPYTREYVSTVLAAHKRFEDQAVVWRDGRSVPATDGWAGAGTRLAAASVPAVAPPAAASVPVVQTTVQVVPPASAATPAVAPDSVRVTVTWHARAQPAPRAVPVVADDFDARLAATRARLDADFGPGLEQRLSAARRTIDAGGPARRG